jgi:hypothetical protein
MAFFPVSLKGKLLLFLISICFYLISENLSSIFKRLSYLFQDFMNAVCTNIVHLNKCHLQNYGGNYDSFIRTRLELLENQAKRYKWEQDQIAHMKVIIVLNAFKLFLENNKRT